MKKIQQEALKETLATSYVYSPHLFQMRLKEEFLRSNRSHVPFIYLEIETKDFDFLGFKQKPSSYLQAWKIAVLTIFSFSSPFDIRGFLPRGLGLGLIMIGKTAEDVQKIKKQILRNLKEAELIDNLRLQPKSPFFQAYAHSPEVEAEHRKTVEKMEFFNHKNDGFFSLDPFHYSSLKNNRWNPTSINWLKRVLDFIGGGVGLILFSPIMLFIMALIKILEPKGSIFFGQERIGMNGDRFTMWKFRSMYMDAEERLKELQKDNEIEGPAFKMKNDPRITPIGRFIRKYSLDELPQLYNVFIGEMALVGPRPPLEREVVEYLPWHKMRLAVKPGLTCHWQVSGRSDIDFDDWMRLDNKYVRHGNLATDLNLIRKTFRAVFKGDGAY